MIGPRYVQLCCAVSCCVFLYFTMLVSFFPLIHVPQAPLTGASPGGCISPYYLSTPSCMLLLPQLLLMMTDVWPPGLVCHSPRQGNRPYTARPGFRFHSLNEIMDG
ncbi:uncharacterized protein BDW47DRAFT_4802 [Aspergillus candidus]|uniref:Uncharacterized protein n=1 Tax=Aspergillus candidus TaxID=41067 RepID=A0A2I2FH77_ASPCN|nr:hypothetical protein BDW47DRAFT_4802 [Aspergillus candidus]PLB39982.1 hypothetical protein BDW47DRAFT_4802 [Aspergillus candidus]